MSTSASLQRYPRELDQFGHPLDVIRGSEPDRGVLAEGPALYEVLFAETGHAGGSSSGLGFRALPGASLLTRFDHVVIVPDDQQLRLGIGRGQATPLDAARARPGRA
ncbi:hypothetical protein [Saccharopolyspora hattusasensis]|uniref:hypothetical protein n=1 Tax=Saccharopolyspora hattusasensis TaxID=1128679 RepID=UPI003D990263